MDDNISLFPCYSLPLRDFLIQHGKKYKLSALNAVSGKKMWIFIDDEKLDACMKLWKETKPTK